MWVWNSTEWQGLPATPWSFSDVWGWSCGFRFVSLQMLFQLWVGQSSECFRRLALLLSPQQLEEPVESGYKVDISSPTAPLHQSISAVTEPLHHALASCLCEVQRSYDFHRHFETQPKMSGSDRTGRAQEKCRELNTLHTSIRSLQLHLKAMLSEWGKCINTSWF